MAFIVFKMKALKAEAARPVKGPVWWQGNDLEDDDALAAKRICKIVLWRGR